MWAKIEKYPGYSVSDTGDVRNDNTGLILKPTRLGDYLGVKLHNRKVYIHHLVAEAFISPRAPGFEVNHINGIKSDNRVSNLEWATHSENNLHRCRVLCHQCKRRVQCVETGKVYPSANEAAEEHRICRPNLVATLNGRHKTCGGYHWRYADA